MWAHAASLARGSGACLPHSLAHINMDLKCPAHILTPLHTLVAKTIHKYLSCVPSHNGLGFEYGCHVTKSVNAYKKAHTMTTGTARGKSDTLLVALLVKKRLGWSRP